ncbi:MAG: RAMP superfamily CRISPR-associated protein [Candidatus Hodarchaeota archaeon]
MDTTKNIEEVRARNKRSKKTPRLKRPRSSQRVLKIYCKTLISKPLNGSVGNSKGSFMLKLAPVTYTYTNKQKKVLKGSVTAYYLKGLRGAIRHKVMNLCHDVGLEVCHSSDKKEDKERNSVIPEGFHPAGACAQNSGSCIVHSIFGGKLQRSLVTISADPIVSMNIEKSAQFIDPVQLVHISTENRNAMAFKGNPLQDFSEAYFSGEFSFEMEVSQCSPAQLGLLITAAYNLERLGRGFSAGYGQLKVVKIQLLQRHLKRQLDWQGDSFVVKEKITEESLKEEVEEALVAWDQYLEEKLCN